MRISAPAAAIALAILATAAPFGAAHAELYKWVDENGVTNYGDAPPKNARQTTALDASKSSLSVVPGLSKDELARLEARADQARADRLERENDELRARLAAASPAPPRSDDTSIAYPPVYVPQIVTRRSPNDRRFAPDRRRDLVHGKPVHRTPPFPGMRLDR